MDSIKRLIGFEKMAEPKVSILMNCYNGEKFLKSSIESVLSQSFTDWELVFWDNRSTDSSAEIYNSYNDSRMKYILAPKHTDLGGARAAAIQHLQGEFFGILDSDDLWLPDKLSRQIIAFENKKVGIVISDTSFFNDVTEKVLYGISSPPTGKVTEALLQKYFISLETVLLRKSFLEKLPYMFDPDFSFIADFDLIFRVSQISELAYCNEVLAKWRVHPNSESWLHVERFALEKERWIKKQLEVNDKLKELPGHIIADFITKNSRQIAIMDLYKGNRIKAMKSVAKTGMKKGMDWLVLMACLAPLSITFVRWWKKRKASLA